MVGDLETGWVKSGASTTDVSCGCLKGKERERERERLLQGVRIVGRSGTNLDASRVDGLGGRVSDGVDESPWSGEGNVVGGGGGRHGGDGDGDGDEDGEDGQLNTVSSHIS